VSHAWEHFLRQDALSEDPAHELVQLPLHFFLMASRPWQPFFVARHDEHFGVYSVVHSFAFCAQMVVSLQTCLVRVHLSTILQLSSHFLQVLSNTHESAFLTHSSLIVHSGFRVLFAQDFHPPQPSQHTLVEPLWQAEHRVLQRRIPE